LRFEKKRYKDCRLGKVFLTYILSEPVGEALVKEMNRIASCSMTIADNKCLMTGQEGNVRISCLLGGTTILFVLSQDNPGLISQVDKYLQSV
jgi:hypothetical protein